jgi:hypothetical protein
METKELFNRWHVLIGQPTNTASFRGVLQERLDILHRLNGLGEQVIEGRPIVIALEETNVLMREFDRASLV